MPIDLCLARLYLRHDGFFFSVGEINNFDNGATWYLLAIDFERGRKPLVRIGLFGAGVAGVFDAGVAGVVED